MGTDIAAFAKQLKEDGIEAARQEADKILSDARDKASAMIAEAKAEADKFQRESQKELALRKQRMDAELKLVARDLIIEVKRKIEQIASFLLRDKVKSVLASEAVVKEAITALLKSHTDKGNWELNIGPTIGKKLAQSVVSDLFKGKEAGIQLAEGLKQTGFELKSLKQSGSGSKKSGKAAVSETGEVIEVTEESVTEAFKLLMSQELAKILSAENVSNG